MPVGLVTAYGEQRVGMAPSLLFYDTFETGLDLVSRYVTSTAGGAIAPAVAGGTLTMGTGTTANGFTSLSSQIRFQPQWPGWVLTGFNQQLEYPTLGNGYRFWGLGTSQATPTAAAPIVDGCGWEVYIDGKMYAVTYAAGVRSIVADLSSSGLKVQPLDSASHTYFVYFRGDRMFWALDNIDNVVTSAGVNVGPANNILPILLLAVANTTAPVASAVLTSGAVYCADTARNNAQISDATYPWRRAKVDPVGYQPVAPMGTQTTILLIGAAGNQFIKASAGRIGQIHNAANQAVTYSIYNAGSAGQVVPANLIAGGLPLTALGPLFASGLQIYCTNGICMVPSAALTANVTVTWD